MPGRAGKAGDKSSRQCSGGSLGFIWKALQSQWCVCKRTIMWVGLSFLPLVQLCRQRRWEREAQAGGVVDQRWGVWAVTGPAGLHPGCRAVWPSREPCTGVVMVEGECRAPPTRFLWTEGCCGCRQSSGQGGSWSWQGFPPLPGELSG